ncbi:S8 family serine peptidase [Pseudobacteriovorax antillogorgiicola]|uniref:Proprotein convertase P-domain-containing protein n=1 Tax=Pseudobacteriovorax antillogorgiicola TaxID=1513793 RepID=A0A1Y6BJJ9_9BACT|nr:S8 family serine peptidase [Pseudobacteriovorax antillogorgiicola]TCS56317.1 proprotein convertase P-domain-containing protein [Pseudobacteriovorax antillogorgiicola]SMF07131.1 Proprotein convertase P-domain-containing protein [Pseudobacteriovorax antillogorgiicola]
MRISLRGSILCLLSIVSASLFANPSPSSGVLVKFKNTPLSIAGKEPSKILSNGTLAYYPIPMQEIALWRIATENQEIEWLEPNYILKLDQLPDDEHLGEQWAMMDEAQGHIHAADAWLVTQGKREVVLGVIDSGVDYSHEDLVDNIWTNPQEIPGNGVDDDDNGYVDDLHGISTVKSSGDPMDTHGHGSHVAGIMGARGNNGKGIAGINWNVQIVGCSFIGAGGTGTTADAIECIDYMIDLKNKGVNIKAINNSWGGGEHSKALEEAWLRAHDAGIVMVSSAGNDRSNMDATPHYPSSYVTPSHIAVGSTDNSDELSSFSNYGVTTVPIAAPGGGIYSTVRNNRYSTMSGTSMASPHIAGAIGLMAARNDKLSATELRDILLEAADRIEGLESQIEKGRRLNLAKAIEFADPTPGFRLNSKVSRLKVSAGESIDFEINVRRIYDWQGAVSFTLDQVPKGLQVDFDREPRTPDEPLKVTILPDVSMTSMKLELRFTATSGDINDSLTIPLRIYPEGTRVLDYETPIKGQRIPSNMAEGLAIPFFVSEPGEVTDIKLELDVKHTWFSDLRGELITPEGDIIPLFQDLDHTLNHLQRTFSFEGLSYTMEGAWILRLVDSSYMSYGTLNEAKLQLVGVRSKLRPKPTILLESDRSKIEIPKDGIIEREIIVEGEGEVLAAAVSYHIEHRDHEDLVILLESPDRSIFKVPVKDSAEFNDQLIISDFPLRGIRGASSPGIWKLIIIAQDGRLTGSIESWSLRLMRAKQI